MGSRFCSLLQKGARCDGGELGTFLTPPRWVLVGIQFLPKEQPDLPRCRCVPGSVSSASQRWTLLLVVHLPCGTGMSPLSPSHLSEPWGAGWGVPDPQQKTRAQPGGW